MYGGWYISYNLDGLVASCSYRVLGAAGCEEGVGFVF